MLKNEEKQESGKEMRENHSDFSGLVDDIFSMAETAPKKEEPTKEPSTEKNEELPPIITKKIKKERKPLFPKKEKKPKPQKPKKQKHPEEEDVKIAKPEKPKKQKKAKKASDDDDVKVFSIPEVKKEEPTPNVDLSEEIRIEEFELTEEPLFPEEAFTVLREDSPDTPEEEEQPENDHKDSTASDELPEEIFTDLSAEESAKPEEETPFGFIENEIPEEKPKTLREIFDRKDSQKKGAFSADDIFNSEGSEEEEKPKKPNLSFLEKKEEPAPAVEEPIDEEEISAVEETTTEEENSAVEETVPEEEEEIPEVVETVPEKEENSAVEDTVPEEEIPAVEETAPEEEISTVEETVPEKEENSEVEETATAMDEELAELLEAIEEPEEPAEDDSHKWTNEAITAISNEHVDEVLPEEELDDKLLLALGYKNADGEVIKNRGRKYPAEKVFALDKEYSSTNEDEYLCGRFKKAKRNVILRLVFTAVFALSIALYPTFASMLAPRIEFFDTGRFFSANTVVCMQLMLLASAFSAPELLGGFLKVFSGKPDVYSAPAFAVVFNAVSCALYAFLAKPDSSLPVSLYTLFAALTLLIPIADDLMRVSAQKRAFSLLTEGESYRLDNVEGEFVLRRGRYPSDIKSRFSEGTRPLTAAKYSVLPTLLLSVVAGMLVWFFKKNASEAIYTSLTFSSLTFPACLLLSSLPFFGGFESKCARSASAVIGRASLDELAAVDSVSVSDKLIFERDSATPLNMELYNNQSIFEMMYCTASVLRGHTSALAKIFETSAEDIELSENVKVVEENENGIGAIVDDRYAVMVGNVAFLEEHRIDIPRDEIKDTNEGHLTPVFIAINGILTAYMAVDYKAGEEAKVISDCIRAEGLKLRVYTDDFCVKRELVAAKLHIREDELELIYAPLPKEKGLASTAILSRENPEAVFETLSSAKSARSADKIYRIISTVLFIASIAFAAVSTALGFTLTPLLALLTQLILMLPVIIAAFSAN